MVQYTVIMTKARALERLQGYKEKCTTDSVRKLVESKLEETSKIKDTLRCLLPIDTNLIKYPTINEEVVDFCNLLAYGSGT